MTEKIIFKVKIQRNQNILNVVKQFGKKIIILFKHYKLML